MTKVLLMTLGIAIGTGIAIIVFTQTIGDMRLLKTYLYDDAVVFRSGMGDILFWQSEYVAPLQNPNEILSVHRLQWDETGFRLPAVPSDHYDVVVLGDSFTEAANVERPWTDTFARLSGLPTRNLAYRGYGIQHYTYTWQTYGRQDPPEILIMGFFGANDIFTAGIEFDPPFPTPREARADDIPAAPVTHHTASETAIYPITLFGQYPVAFLTTYMSWMNTDADQLLGSVNYRVIQANLETIRDSADPDTCLVFVYFPSKSEVYFPYIATEDYARILEGQKNALINSDGTLHLVEDFNISVERVMNNHLNTGNIMTDLAQSLGYHALNLQIAFDQAAAQEEMLYYAYDTHWNQSGQDLAGETIASYVQAHCMP